MTTEYQRQMMPKWHSQREAELAPMLARISELVEGVGWSRARVVVLEEIYGHDVARDLPALPRNGSWRKRVGKRNGRRIIERLESIGVQGRLFT